MRELTTHLALQNQICLCRQVTLASKSAQGELRPTCPILVLSASNWTVEEAVNKTSKMQLQLLD